MRALKSPQTTTVFFCCQCSISTVKALRSSANSAWLREIGRTYALTSTSEFCLDLLFNRTHGLIKLLPFPTQLRDAAHDILFDQEPCSATGSNLSCVPSP
jgi:hypothetical protein